MTAQACRRLVAPIDTALPGAVHCTCQVAPASRVCHTCARAEPVPGSTVPSSQPAVLAGNAEPAKSGSGADAPVRAMADAQPARGQP